MPTAHTHLLRRVLGPSIPVLGILAVLLALRTGDPSVRAAGDGAGPMITVQPVSTIVVDGETATFEIAAPDGVDFQWRRDGVPIGGGDGDGEAGGGSSTLTIALADAADVGVYDCLVSNDAGSTTSATAILAVRPSPDLIPGACCLDDGTCIRVSNAICFAIGGAYQGPGTSCDFVDCPPPPPPCEPDLDGSGAVDFSDLINLIGAWGPCS